MEEKQQKIFIIIPAFNEEDKIASVLRELKKHYKHIVVVDDCSSDNTYNIVKEIDVVLLHHPINRGQGAALETGDSYARMAGADIVVHFDADGQFLVEEIKKIINPILIGRADMVMGSRFMNIETNMPKFKKYFIMPLARFFLRSIYGVVLTDPQNGFRAFSSNVLNKLYIENDGAAHCTEIIAKTLKNKWRFEEVAISVHYDKFGAGLLDGKGRGAGGIKILKSLFLQKLIK